MKKKSWLKIIGAIFIALVIGIVIVLWVAWDRVLPVVIRLRMESEILKAWKGPVRVSDVRFGYGGELNVGEIYLGDKAGREWVNVEGLKVGLENWPSLSPGVRAVDVNRIDVKLYFDEGKSLMPIHVPEKRKAPSDIYEGIDIPDITIKYGSITLSQVDGPTVVYDNIRFSVADTNGLASISLARDRPETREKFSLDGTVSTLSGDVDLSLKLTHRITEDETSILLGMVTPEGDWGASGQVNGECRFKGPIAARQNMTMEGNVSIAGASISDSNGQIAGDINARATINGQRVDIKPLIASAAGGQLTGALFADNVLSYPIDYGGDISADNIDLPQLSVAFGSSSKISKGVVSGQFTFRGTSKSADDLEGNLTVHLRGAELSMMPTMALVFKTIALGKYDPAAASDADGEFEVNGPVLTSESAQVSNSLGAIKVEPGGTYNVRSKDIDAYVVAVPLAQVQETIERVPVAELLMRFKDKLVRLHLKGNVKEPDKLISKEPLKDIGEGAVDVLKGAVETGKDVGEGVLKGIKGILGGDDKKKDEDK